LNKRRALAFLFLLVLASVIFLGMVNTPAMGDEADCGHAIASRELLETHDWVILHINGIRWLEKPPVLFWLGAASYRLLGESVMSARLPVAIAAILLVLLIYEFGRRWFGDRAGFYAALIFCTSFGVYLYTRTMIAESLYALEFTALFYLFLRGWEGSLPIRPAWWGAAVLMALATLTRGLIGAIFPCAAIFLFLAATGGWGRWRELPLLSSALVFLGVAAPWHVMAGARAKHFYWFYFLNEHVYRAIQKRVPQDYAAVPRWLWWPEHLAWFFPWSIFIFYALKEMPHWAVWKKDGEGAANVTATPARSYVEPRLLLFLWAGFILFFFTVSSRLEYYSFGAWPAIALLLGAGLASAEEESSRWLRWLQGALAALGAVVAAMLGVFLWMSRGIRVSGDIASVLGLRPEENYKTAMASIGDIGVQTFAALRWPAAAAGVILLIGFGVAYLLRRRARHWEATIAVALTAAGFLFAANGALHKFEPYISSRVLAAEMMRVAQPGDQIATYGDFYGACSVSFYMHQKMWIWNGRYYGLAFGANYPDAPQIFLDNASFAKLWGGAERVFLVVPATHRQEARGLLPVGATYLLAEGGGKAVYVNRSITPGQPSIGEMEKGPGDGAAQSSR
jgi:4-amino-4-deoxy-L-arabinose transferase-like glycosyltransferase